MTTRSRENLLKHRERLERAIQDLKSGQVGRSGRASQWVTHIQEGRLDTIEQRIASIEKRIGQISDLIERDGPV